jgi:hypothetical protein
MEISTENSSSWSESDGEDMANGMDQDDPAAAETKNAGGVDGQVQRDSRSSSRARAKRPRRRARGETKAESAISSDSGATVRPRRTANGVLLGSELSFLQPVTDEDVVVACGEFLRWLSDPPITPFEVPIKQRRVRDAAQLKPIKSNLKFIFGLLLEKKCISKLKPLRRAEERLRVAVADEDATPNKLPQLHDVAGVGEAQPCLGEPEGERAPPEEDTQPAAPAPAAAAVATSEPRLGPGSAAAAASTDGPVDHAPAVGDPVPEAPVLALSVFVELHPCRTLHHTLVERKIGYERMFQLFLLVKKVLVFLSSARSIETKTFFPPTTFPSFVYVDALCREATERRKQSARNRKFGILVPAAMQQTLVAGAMAAPPAGLAAPARGGPRSAAQVDERGHAGGAVVRRAALPSAYGLAAGREATTYVGHGQGLGHGGIMARVQSEDGSLAGRTPMSCTAAPAAMEIADETMTLAEMKRLTKYALDRLRQAATAAAASQQLQADGTGSEHQVQPPSAIISAINGSASAASASADSTALRESDHRGSFARQSNPLEGAKLYARYLVTLTLLLGLAPRSQVLKGMQMGSTFLRDSGGSGSYCIRMPAEMSKNHKPTVLPLHACLTPLYDHYFARVRPLLLRGLPPSHDTRHVFVKEDGRGPRAEFSSWTRQVTREALGKAYNAHAFRHAVITSLYEAGSTQAQMDQLATLMQHDVSVARDVYFRPQMMQAASAAAARLAELVMEPVLEP